jgi:hypothetical protein
VLIVLVVKEGRPSPIRRPNCYQKLPDWSSQRRAQVWRQSGTDMLEGFQEPSTRQRAASEMVGEPPAKVLYGHPRQPATAPRMLLFHKTRMAPTWLPDCLGKAI